MTNLRSHANEEAIQSNPNPAPAQLSACNRAALLVTKCVLKSRAQKGENWFRVAHLSRNGTDLASVMRFIPKPMTSAFQPGEFEKVYKAALECTISPFDSILEPIDVDDFVDWVSEGTQYSPSVSILACIYIDRLFAINPELFLRKTNVQRFFATAYMIAGKFLEDEPVAYSKWMSEAIEIKPADLSFLETLFLTALRHDLNVTKEQLEEAEISLMTEAIESEWSTEVSKCLRKENILGYHTAVLNKCENMCRIDLEQKKLQCDQMDDGVTGFDQALQRCPTWRIIRELAEAQLTHDLESEGCAFPEKPLVMSEFTANGQKRYQKLLALADGNTFSDLKLPPLERVGCPFDRATKATQWERSEGPLFERFGRIDDNNAMRWAWCVEEMDVQSVRVLHGCVDEMSAREVEKLMGQR